MKASTWQISFTSDGWLYEDWFCLSFLIWDTNPFEDFLI